MTTYTRILLSDGLVLKADSNGWTIAEARTYGSGKRAGEEYDYDLAYPGSFYNALLALQERRLRQSEATTLAGLTETIRSFRREVSDLLEPRLNVRVPK